MHEKYITTIILARHLIRRKKYPAFPQPQRNGSNWGAHFHSSSLSLGTEPFGRSLPPTCLKHQYTCLSGSTEKVKEDQKKHLQGCRYFSFIEMEQEWRRSWITSRYLPPLFNSSDDVDGIRARWGETYLITQLSVPPHVWNCVRLNTNTYTTYVCFAIVNTFRTKWTCEIHSISAGAKLNLTLQEMPARNQ